ncbi:MAG: hypothetical protein ACOYLF_05580 [Blastocatellia bacterium]|jgi:hypothetical protein
MIKLVVLANLASTFFMVGLIWFVQIVHYPLFDRVGREGFSTYESSHSQLTSLVVIPPMLVELMTTGMLLLARPVGMRLWEAVVGALLLAVVWGSTFLLQVPRHGELAMGFDQAAHSALVATNWLRTIAWSLRGVLWLIFLERTIKSGATA